MWERNKLDSGNNTDENGNPSCLQKGRIAMNTYHDRYARFGVIIGILVGVAIIVIVGLVSSC